MSRRLGQPNLPADDQLHTNLLLDEPQNFVMIAGAGSGKTTSLIKALAVVIDAHGDRLAARGEQVACITYTEVAANEIREEVGDSDLFHVSTVHSFLWSLIKPLQRDISRAVGELIDTKIAETQAKIDNAGPRTHATTLDRYRAQIEQLTGDRSALPDVRSFTYLTGSKYAEGILGHEDVISIACGLLMTKPLLRVICAQRFPFVFVDESQDTFPRVVEALVAVSEERPDTFCLGFFGDPMQKIYTTGIGEIEHDGWLDIPKPENFRCPTSVLDVANAIRRADDGLQQVAGVKIDATGAELPPVEGAAIAIVLPATEDRSARTGQIIEWIAERQSDPDWLSVEGDVRVLLITHRMAAARLGFDQLYGAFHDRTSERLKNAFDDGTSRFVRPVVDVLFPLAQAYEEGDQRAVLASLRPAISTAANREVNVAQHLEQLKNALADIMAGYAEGAISIGELLGHATAAGIIEPDDELQIALDVMNEDQGEDGKGEGGDAAGIQRYLALPCSQLHGYREYLTRQSPYATHQGVKGAEFKRVLVVLDDRAARFHQFSYEKLFGVADLSAADRKNREAGDETVIERTRRLLYVCCTRATESLAVVFFAEDSDKALEQLRAASLFSEECVFGAEDLGWADTAE